MKSKSEDALSHGKSVFGARYVLVVGAKMDCDLAPRNSMAFPAISFLSELSHSARPVASRENFLLAPPAPEAMCWVDESNVQALEVAAMAGGRGWRSIGGLRGVLFVNQSKYQRS